MARFEARAIISAEDRTKGAFERIGARLKALSRTSRRVEAATANAAVRRISATTRSMQAIERAQRVNAGLLTAGALMRGAPALAAGYGAYKATQSSLSLEKSMYDVQRATNASGGALDDYRTQILDLSRASGKTKEELAGMLAAAGFAGRPTGELIDFTRYAAKATTAWGTTAGETGQALAELGNIYGANQKRIEEIGDAVNAVADNSASRETDLLDFLRRTGATGNILGISAEKMLAYGAAMKEVGVTSEVASTGMNALLNKITTAADDKDWAKQLKALGIDAKAFAKAVKSDASKAIVELLGKIDQIPDGSRKLQVLQEMFGKEYADDVAKLAGNLSGLSKQLEFVANRANYLGSVSKGFELIKDTDFNKLDRAARAIDVLAQRMGGPLKRVVGEVAEEFNKVLDGASFLERWEAERRARREAQGLPPDEEIPDQRPSWLKDLEQRRADFADSIWGKPGQRDQELEEARRRGRMAATDERLAHEETARRRPAEIAGQLRDARGRHAAMEGLPQMPPTSAAGRTQQSALAASKALIADLEQQHEHASEVARRVEQLGALDPQALKRLEQAKAVMDRRARLIDPAGGPQDHGPVGSGLTNFGFGRHGLPAEPARGLPAEAPLPPIRPDTEAQLDRLREQAAELRATISGVSPLGQLDGAVLEAFQTKLREVTAEIERLSGQTVAPQVDASQVDTFKTAVTDFSTAFAGLNTTVTPNVDATPLRTFIGLVDTAASKLAALDGQARSTLGTMQKAAAASAAARAPGASQQASGPAPRPHANRTTFSEYEQYAFDSNVQPRHRRA